jgi:hypothetical protein
MSLQETEFQSELYGRAYGEKPMIMGFIRLNEAIDCKIKVSGLGLTAGGTPVTGEDLDCTVTINATVPIYTTDSGQKAEDGSIYVYPHQHLFRNLPLTLTPTYEAMRGSASGIDGGSPIASGKVENGLTCPEVKGTTKEASVGLQNQLGSNKFTPLEV